MLYHGKTKSYNDVKKYIRENPGVRLDEIKAQFRSSFTVLRYTLEFLVEDGLILAKRDGTDRRLVRYFPVDGDCSIYGEKVAELTATAKTLETRRLYRRAACVWFRAFSLPDLPADMREEFLTHRQRCYRRASIDMVNGDQSARLPDELVVMGIAG